MHRLTAGVTVCKALITLAGHNNTNFPEAREARREIDEVLADREHSA
jgi:hypothetical protein